MFPFAVDARRKKELLQQQRQEQLIYYSKTREQAEFELRSSEKAKHQWKELRVRKLFQSEQIELDSRQLAVEAILRAEEEAYERSLESKKLTQEQRIDQMKQKVSSFKALREEERKKVAEDRKMQQWRLNCDELRSVESKLFERKVTEERGVQIEELFERNRQEAEEKKRFDAVWEMERQKKIVKEEKEREERHGRDMETWHAIKEQIRELHERNEQERKLKLKVAELLKQELEMQKLEEQRKRLRDEQEKKRIRLELDRFNRRRIQQRQKEIQEALEMDMKILKEFAQMEEADILENQRKKDELRKELQSYIEYMEQEKRAEQESEKEVDAVYHEELEKMWKSREERWRKEQHARDRLMQDVIAVRQEQIKEKSKLSFQLVEKNRREQQLSEFEKEKLLADIQENSKADQLRRERLLEEQFKYKMTLEQQINVSKEGRRKEDERIHKEYLQEKAAFDEYQRILDAEIARAMEHPGTRSYFSKANV